jgi:UDP-N-acetylmuramyl tripeptide synthase
MSFTLSLVQKLHGGLAKLGRGGSLPGKLAIKLDPDFLSRFQMPPIVVLVTGTNGKTTTSNLIAESLRAGGLKVINNHRGDNLNVGIATLLAAGSDSHYVVQADAAVIEIDELTVYRQFKNLHPTHLVVTNFFRDQLDRAGEMETIIRRIMEVTKDFTGDLILNGDDPNVLRIADNAQKARVHYFSVGENLSSRKISDEAGEGKFCPRCGRRLIYSYYQYSHIGRFYCPYDGFGKIAPDILAQKLDFINGTFEVDGRTYHSFVNTIYGIYNCCAVLTVLKSLKRDPAPAAEVFASYHLKEGRNETFQLSRPCVINLIKNPTGANEVMKYVIAQPGIKNICIVLNDNDQDGHDISWIWDAHFERLNDPLVKTIVCSGRRAYDMALRLKYEGMEDKVLVLPETKKAVAWLDDDRTQSFVMATYTALHPTRHLLHKLERPTK